jgi:uncharacterized damage-inducible protein DinB
MTRDELLAALGAEHVVLEKYLKAVGVDRMHITGISGFYSAKDILAHLEAYDRAIIIWLDEARAGRVYVDPVVDQPDLDARNAIVYARNRDRSAEDILASFRQTSNDLEARVERLTDDELNNVEATAWFVEPRWRSARELWKCIANDSYEHYQQHLPDFQRWLVENN